MNPCPAVSAPIVPSSPIALPPRPTVWRVVVVGSAVLLALGLAACKGDPADAKPDAKGGPDAAAKKDDAVPVETAPVARRPIAASYNGTATLDAPAEAQVIAKAPGVVLELYVEEGQMVQAGQVMARLNPERAPLQLAQAEAQMRKLENNYHRSQELLAKKLVSAEANDQIKYDLQNARAAYNLAKLEMSYTKVVAPISGVVAQRMVKLGNLVQLSSALFRIVDMSQLEAVLNVPERELATMQSGLPVLLRVDALPGVNFKGRIDRVSPVVDAGSGTFRVVCAFDGDARLKPGMFGRIEVVYDQRKNALTIPRGALLEDEGEPAVFAVREGKAVRVPVQLGYLSGALAEIRTGLKEGEQVVTAGKVTLRNGTKVQVLGDNKPAADSKPAARAADTAVGVTSGGGTSS